MNAADMIQTQDQLDTLRLFPKDGGRICRHSSSRIAHQPLLARIPAAEVLEDLIYRGLVASTDHGSVVWLTKEGIRALQDLQGLEALPALTLQEIMDMTQEHNVRGMHFDTWSDSYYPQDISEYDVRRAAEGARETMVRWTHEALSRVKQTDNQR